MQNVTKLLAALAFLVVSTSFTGNANAWFKVRVDCHGTGGIPEWAPTYAQTRWTAVVKDGTTKTLEYFDMNPQDCSSDNSENIRFNMPYSAYQVTRIIVTIFGPLSDDMFFLDKLQLRDHNGNVVAQWGINNTTGYCFSTDWRDDGYAECVNKQAYTTWNFVM